MYIYIYIYILLGAGEAHGGLRGARREVAAGRASAGIIINDIINVYTSLSLYLSLSLSIYIYMIHYNTLQYNTI